MKFPAELRYSKEHEWVRPGGATFRIGISDYAQAQLGDIVFIELPKAGATFSAGDEFGTVESVKAASELFMPIDAEVVTVNTQLEDSPEIVNTSPYDDGWMVEVKPKDPSQIDTLFTRDQYLGILNNLD
ncbi:MAG: glycine cleavage system protein GcvH [Desulfobacterales bacterium]|nr:glycine cleavage system protein GcvH [Desulfobacterales bacterium]